MIYGVSQPCASRNRLMSANRNGCRAVEVIVAVLLRGRPWCDQHAVLIAPAPRNRGDSDEIARASRTASSRDPVFRLTRAPPSPVTLLLTPGAAKSAASPSISPRHKVMTFCDFAVDACGPLHVSDAQTSGPPSTATARSSGRTDHSSLSARRPRRLVRRSGPSHGSLSATRFGLRTSVACD